MASNRREFLKQGLVVAGGLVVGASALESLARPFDEGKPIEYALPELPFAYAALEPHIGRDTMEVHHSKHHAGYVKNLNAILSKEPRLKTVKLDELLLNLDAIEKPAVRTGIRNNGGGHWNHSFFWTLLTPNLKPLPARLEQALVESFGSVEEFRKAFEAAALNLFGSGWVWLGFRLDGKLDIYTTAEQDNLMMLPLDRRAQPILALDVWEHAYYLNYQNRRKDYVQSFWNVVNWEQADKYYEKAFNG